MTFTSSEHSALNLQGILAGFLDQPLFGDVLQRDDWHRTHAPGSTVLSKGSIPKGLYVVVHGTLEMILSNRNGSEHTVRIAKAGDCLAIEAVLCDIAVVYELRTLTRATLLFVPTATVMAWIDRSPVFARRLMHLMADDVGYLYEELDGIQTRSAVERLACYLHCGEGRGRRGQEIGDDFSISLPFVKLAQRLGASQPHLSRALRNLEDAGVISRDGRRVHVRDNVAFNQLLCTACRPV